MSHSSSKLWKEITVSLFSNINEEFLQTFRAPGGANRRLAAWDPYDKSTRYYKFLLFNVARGKPKEFFQAYRSIGPTHIGNPVTVSVQSSEINIDHLFAVEEFLFIEQNCSEKEIRHVVEIGAGFGRTCQSLLKLSPLIESYTIVDLPEVLKLSRAYLEKSIPELFEKIRFISNEEMVEWESLKADLVINIDSFQEMPPAVIDNYRDKIVNNAAYFYCKNPVGKYEASCVGLPKLNADQLLDVYSLGYCQEVLDIFDEEKLRRCRERYLEKYRPSESWDVLAEMPLEIFPYFHHAIFKNRKKF
jgi:putative sugar O-methyltransferase